jgi:hypothetical protein
MGEIDFSKETKFNLGKKISHGYIFGINFDLERYGAHFGQLFVLYYKIQTQNYDFSTLIEYKAILGTIYTELASFFGATESKTYKKQLKKAEDIINEQRQLYHELSEYDYDELQKGITLLTALHEKIMIKKQLAGLGMNVEKEMSLGTKLKNALG